MPHDLTEMTATGVAPAVGPYSHAVVCAGMVYVSGNVALNVAGELVSGTAEEEARGAIGNLRTVLQSVGSDFKDVVKTTVFLVDMADYPSVNKIYGELFGDHAPARSCVAVAQLPLGARVEIEAIAKHRE